MSNLNNNKIEKLLKELIIQPDELYKNSLRSTFDEKGVTKSRESRNSYSIFYLLLKFTMSKTTRIALAGVMVVVLLFGGMFFAVSSADASAPGDLLYPIDRAYESVQRLLALSPEAKASLELDLLDERAEELDSLNEEGADDSLVDEAIDNLEEQDIKTKERVRDAEDNENSDEGELERLRERLELLTQENLQLMQKIQEQYKTEEKKGSDELNSKINEYTGKLEQEEENENENEMNSDSHDGEGQYQEQEEQEKHNQNSDDNSEDDSDDEVEDEDEDEHEDEKDDDSNGNMNSNRGSYYDDHKNGSNS